MELDEMGTPLLGKGTPFLGHDLECGRESHCAMEVAVASRESATCSGHVKRMHTQLRTRFPIGLYPEHTLVRDPRSFSFSVAKQRQKFGEPAR